MALTNNKVQFAYFANKTDFTAELQTSLTNSIVFVEDTKEVYTHGTFFGIQAVTLNYDSASTKLQLKDGSAVISEIDATPFIKDGMIDSVELVTTPEGSSAVLSVNGTNYPIVELDVSELQKVSQNGDEFYVIQNSNGTKAYKIVKEENDHVGFVFTQYGSFLCTTEDTDVPLYFYNGVTTEALYPDGSWKSVTIDDIPFSIGGSTYYGTNGQDMSVEDLDATETTGSASNNNYPTLPYLKFTFNIVKESESGTPISSHQVVRVSVADLVDTYDGANVNLSSTYAKAVSYADPAINDSVDTAVGKLTKGLNDAQAQLLWNEYAGA